MAHEKKALAQSWCASSVCRLISSHFGTSSTAVPYENHGHSRRGVAGCGITKSLYWRLRPRVSFGRFACTLLNTLIALFLWIARFFSNSSKSKTLLFATCLLVTLAHLSHIIPFAGPFHLITSLWLQRLKASTFGNIIYRAMSLGLDIRILVLGRFGNIYFWAMRLVDSSAIMRAVLLIPTMLTY